MKSWAVKRDDGSYLLNKLGTVRLYKTRKEAQAAADRAKGTNKVSRVEISDV